MEKTAISKKAIESIVKKFNKEILADGEKLPTGKGKGETKEMLMEELAGAAKEVLQPGDEKLFNEEEVEILLALEVDFYGLTGAKQEEDKCVCICEEEVEAKEDTMEKECEVEEIEEKKPEKKEKKKPEKKEKKKPEKKSPKIDSARGKIFKQVENGNMTQEKIIDILKEDVPEKLIKMYLRAWQKGDRCPKGDRLIKYENGTLEFK